MGRLQRKNKKVSVKTTRAKKELRSAVKVNVVDASESITVGNKQLLNKTVKPAAVKSGFIVYLRNGLFFKRSALFLFLKEVKLELKKVIWPSYKQAFGSSIVVVVVVCFMALFLGLVDMALSGMFKAFLK